MKRLVMSAFIIAFTIALAACAGTPAQGPAVSLPSADVSETITEAPEIKAGFSIAEEGALSEQLAADIKNECASLGISSQVSVASSPEQQLSDISSMFSAGVSVVVISPLDPDSLDAVLAERDIYDVRVINALSPINGAVDMLISPDYKGIGTKAGQCAVELTGAQGTGCMTLCTDYDSFTMQMMSDGFKEAIRKDKDISLVSEQFCGNDEEAAYSAAKAELASKNIGFIFAQNSALGRGAMRAIEESGKDVKLAVFGGDMDIIKAVSEGKAYASVFFGPGALAHESVLHADNFIKSGSYTPPQYVELNVVVVKQSDAAGYQNETAAHAEIK